MRPPSGTLRAVTFDCWSTLIYDKEPVRNFQLRISGFVELLRRRGLDVTPAQAQGALEEGWKSLYEAWARGHYRGVEEAAEAALAVFGEKDPRSIERLVAVLQNAPVEGGVGVLDGARDTLEALRARGLRTALVCDTGLTPGRRVRGLLAHTELLGSLEVLVFSDEVGVPKPHARMFSTALSALGIEPADAVHVGDMRRTDVAGARAFGMGTVRLRGYHDDRSEYPEADVVVDSHARLRRLLGL